jgi:hypothetical protein
MQSSSEDVHALSDCGLTVTDPSGVMHGRGSLYPA